jgi:hypothetical protein
MQMSEQRFREIALLILQKLDEIGKTREADQCHK